MKLTHPAAPGVVIEPKAEHAAEYQSQGWVTHVEKPEPAPKPDEKK